MRDALVELLRGVERAEASGHRVAVIGGLARGVWATPRATMDVDILIDTVDLPTVEARAASWGLWAVARFPKGPIRLDILSADHPRPWRRRRPGGSTWISSARSASGSASVRSPASGPDRAL